jgi:alpha-galactosidase
MQICHLQGKNSSFIIAYDTNHLPECLYWGQKISIEESIHSQPLLQTQAIPQGTIDSPSLGSLLPILAEGDFSLNAIEIIGNKSWSPRFKVKSANCNNGQAIFECIDDIARLKVNIRISLNSNDVIEKSLNLTNLGNKEIIVTKLLNTLILPAEINEITQYHGRWICEAQEPTTKWSQPRYQIENIKGRTSHDNQTMLRVQQLGTNNNSGLCYGFSLAHSGNHTYTLTRLDNNHKAVQWGERLIADEIVLSKDKIYTTPSLLVSISFNGFNELRQNYHNHIRQSNQLAIHHKNYRPVQINTWEAVYFDHNVDTFKKMIDKASEFGIERFVLDDGWFKGRNNDKAGLGDWFVDENKYPQGLHPLVDYTIAKGLEFGLWFEPEMVNPDSDLYRNHPEWILALPEYQQKLGRYQFALNLANKNAYNYILKCITDILNEYKISYAKWDMNRDLIQAAGCDNKPSYHNQVLATYRLLSIEFGILRYTNRFWSSDCNDPLERQSIHKSLSQFYPPEVLGAHVGPYMAHTIMRVNNFEYALITCFASHLGFEQNILNLDNQQSELFKHYIALYKKHRPLLHNSDHYYLDYNDESIAQIFVAKDKSKALLMFFQNSMPANMSANNLKINGLDNHKLYEIKALNEIQDIGYAMKALSSICKVGITLSGEILNRIGLAIPIMHPQSALLIEITENYKNDKI